ncbi:MAG: hypothetical protein JXX14_22695 [Deltaproteobacteria bacterium]|nr:hypothetical protein [Deltaproteobacteria bacterium]
MTASSWVKQKERGTSLGMRLMLFVLNTFGYPIASLLLYPVVLYFYITGKRARDASLYYLRRVHSVCRSGPLPGLRQSHAHFVSFAQSSLDRMWFWQSKTDRFQIHTDELDQIQKYLDQGRGCLLLGAHFGNLDSLRVLCGEQQVRLNAVMYLENAKRFNQVLNAINPDSQLNIINLKDRSIDGVMAMKNCIENGELVAMLADRFHPSARTRVVTSSFLGEDASFPANPWLVASLLECPTFFVAGIKIGRRTYRGTVQFVCDKVQIDRSEREADLKKYVAEYVGFLTALCCRYPYQWFNFYDFWRADDHLDAPDNR